MFVDMMVRVCLFRIGWLVNVDVAIFYIGVWLCCETVRERRFVMNRPHLLLCSFLITTLLALAACGSAPQSTRPAVPTASPSALQQAFAGNYKGKIVSVGAEWMDSDYLTSLREFERRTGINIQYSSIGDESDPPLISEINA